MKTAQQICDAIDAFVGDTSRSREQTILDVRKIAARASMFAALPANAEEELSESYEIED